MYKFVALVEDKDWKTSVRILNSQTLEEAQKEIARSMRYYGTFSAMDNYTNANQLPIQSIAILEISSSTYFDMKQWFNDAQKQQEESAYQKELEELNKKYRK